MLKKCLTCPINVKKQNIISVQIVLSQVTDNSQHFAITFLSFAILDAYNRLISIIFAPNLFQFFFWWHYFFMEAFDFSN